jgi:hypothetical protein
VSPIWQIQLLSPGRPARESVQRRRAGLGIDKTDRSRRLSPRIEILTDIEPQLSMLSWFHRSTQVRSACAEEAGTDD